MVNVKVTELDQLRLRAEQGRAVWQGAVTALDAARLSEIEAEKAVTAVVRRIDAGDAPATAARQLADRQSALEVIRLGLPGAEARAAEAEHLYRSAVATLVAASTVADARLNGHGRAEAQARIAEHLAAATEVAESFLSDQEQARAAARAEADLANLPEAGARWEATRDGGRHLTVELRAPLAEVHRGPKGSLLVVPFGGEPVLVEPVEPARAARQLVAELAAEASA